MAASLLRPKPYRFATGPVLASGSPRPPPSGFGGHGAPCFKAHCLLQHGDDTIASFYGYDKSLDIITEVENACRLHSHVTPGTECTPTRLTFLPTSARDCSGQLYFTFEEFDDKKKRM